MPHDIVIVEDKNKITKEMLLLGSKTVVKKDCRNHEALHHGLMANDLSLTRPDGITVSLLQAITEAGGGNVDLSTSTVTTDAGSVFTIKQIAESLEGVPTYTVADATAQYNS